jgi:hypothetical protein
MSCRTVRAVDAAPPERQERADLRREQLASDQVKALQKRLIIPTGSSSILGVKMMAVRVGRRAPYLGAARDEQSYGEGSVTC